MGKTQNLFLATSGMYEKRGQCWAQAENKILLLPFFYRSLPAIHALFWSEKDRQGSSFACVDGAPRLAFWRRKKLVPSQISYIRNFNQEPPHPSWRSAIQLQVKVLLFNIFFDPALEPRMPSPRVFFVFLITSRRSVCTHESLAQSRRNAMVHARRLITPCTCKQPISFSGEKCTLFSLIQYSQWFNWNDKSYHTLSGKSIPFPWCSTMCPFHLSLYTSRLSGKSKYTFHLHSKYPSRLILPENLTHFPLKFDTFSPRLFPKVERIGNNTYFNPKYKKLNSSLDINTKILFP